MRPWDIFGVSREWAADRRCCYLRDEISRLKAELPSRIIGAGRILMNIAGPHRDSLEYHILARWLEADIGDIEKRITSMARELKFRSSEGEHSWRDISPGDIDAARNFPLWRLLGKSPKNLVKCPFHDDTRPSLYLYPVRGYCPVCAKTVNSVDWLMHVHHYGFTEAVEHLLGMAIR